jgi:hypothetical protein
MDNTQKKRAHNAVYARKRRRGPASTNARAIRRAQRQAAVLKARLECRSFRDIGQELNVSASNAYRLCVEAMGELLPVEDLETIRKTELARLDRMQAAISAKAEAGDKAAIATALKIMERRASYLGLDKVDPKQISNATAEPMELHLHFKPGIEDAERAPPIIDHEPIRRLPPPAGYNCAAGARVDGYDPLSGKPQPEVLSSEPPQERPRRQSEPKPELQKDWLHIDSYASMSKADRRKFYGGCNGEGVAPGESVASLGRRRHWMG